jgi:hypothetical protein
MNRIASRTFRSLAAATLLIGASAASAAESPDGKALAAELFTYLGLDQAKRGQLQAGEVVHNGLSKAERLPDEIVAAGAMLIVKAPNAAAVVDAFLHSETFQRIFQVRRQQAAQGGRVELAAFSTLPVPDAGRLRDIVKAPARHLNVSKSEADSLKSLATTTNDLQAQFRTDFGQILSARLNSYVKQGLAGVQPYVRDNGSVVSPAAELGNAIRSLAFLSDEFPGFVDALGKPSSASSALLRNYYWMERPADKESVLTLSVEDRQRQAKAAVGADVHFYASRDYNSMLTVVGVVPYGGDWMVFALNHTFTDQVTGFGSTVKRAVGRDLVATELAKQLAETRRRLGSGQAQR